MRPGALTQAARRAASKQQDAASRAVDRPRASRTTPSRAVDRPPASRTTPEAFGERRVSRPTRPPRRLSGPVRGKVYASRSQSATPSSGSSSADRPRRPVRAPRGAFASGSAAVAAAVALPLRPFIDREPLPRRAPRPAPRPATDRRPAKAAKPTTGVLRGIGAFIVSLPDHALLDRVVRGRAWIPLLGVLLAGMVAAQVEILKLGASMGRSLEQTTTLTSQNELLRDSVAALSDDQRIEHLATNMGMVLPPPGAVGYLNVGQSGNVTGALVNIHAPDPAAFMALAPVNGALVTGPGASMLPSSSGVLAQAGTPGSATPTSTPSATSTVTTAGTTASAGTTTGPASTTTTSSTPPGTTSSQAPPAEQPPPATTPTAATTATTAATTPTDSQGVTTGTQPTPTDSQTGSQTPATGAAVIQPAGPTQQSSGG